MERSNSLAQGFVFIFMPHSAKCLHILCPGEENKNSQKEFRCIEIAPIPQRLESQSAGENVDEHCWVVCVDWSTPRPRSFASIPRLLPPSPTLSVTQKNNVRRFFLSPCLAWHLGYRAI
ncbi:hypothetical protein TcWFU_001877 [Taenia crassiceps]|uniref:Uncharacterized protein n=1 Tax=Taenia crassiceps TaxID=6207 RepID=A0ABR4QJL5_9CEST